MLLLLIVHLIQVGGFAGISVWKFSAARAGLGWLFAAFSVVSVGLVILDAESLHFERLTAESQQRLGALQRPPVISNPQDYGMIHKPKTGCPPGFRFVPDIFERGGVKGSGCANPANKSGPLDYLMPGESIHFEVRVGPEDEQHEI